MFWIILAWYLVGVIMFLLGVKVIDGYVTVGSLTVSLVWSGVLGPMVIVPIVAYIVTNSEICNKKLF